jgi:hypothetical protein
MSKGGLLKAQPEVNRSLAEYEEAIRQVRGVTAARVVADSRGAISEIHVLAGPGRGPKQIVRDIESSLMAQFGLSVDHKKISVAQVDETAAPLMSWGTGRIRLLNVSYTVTSTEAEAEVEVEFDDVVHRGRACGPVSTVNRLRVTAEATLRAVGEYLDSDRRFALDDVSVIDLRWRKVVLTMLSLLAPGGEEVLIGTSLLRANEAEAVARSVLDALNRRFTVLLRKSAPRDRTEGPGSGDGPAET